MKLRTRDPLPFMGIPSGIEETTIVLTSSQAVTLTRAAEIIDEAHDLISKAMGDDHYELTEPWCGIPDALRDLAKGKLS